MEQLEKCAQKIINEKKRTKDEISRRLEAEKAKKLLQLNNEFKKGFNDVLDLLLEAGIAWQAKYQNDTYGDAGYIEFTKGTKSLKMDFSTAKSYRYCYTSLHNGIRDQGPMVYGEWSKDEFIVWIYQNLMVEKQEEVAA